MILNTADLYPITGFGLVSSDSSSAGALIVGIEPGRECEITQFVTLVKEGDRLAPGDDRRVLLGVTLARNLQVGVGDTVVVLTQGYRNQMGADTYLVKGTVGMGNAELERGLLIMPLHNAQELFSLYDGITQVVVSTTDFRKANSRAKRLMALLADQRKIKERIRRGGIGPDESEEALGTSVPGMPIDSADERERD